MQRQSDQAVAAEQSFLEHQFYSGGLRAEAFSLSGARPSWAPQHDWVGFRNEFALEADDQLVEVVKFRFGNDVVSWVGVYRAAPDRIYGDRKNHAGFGVWLLNRCPKEPALLVDALWKLLEIAQANEADRLGRQVKKVLEGYLKEVVDEYELLPRPFGGLATSQNQVVSTVVRRIDKRSQTAEGQLDDFVRRLFYYLPDDLSSNSRALLLLSDSPKSREIPSPENQRGNLVTDLISQLPLALREQSHRVSLLEQELSKERAALEDLDNQTERLHADVLAARARANEAEAQLNDLRASLEEDDERKRFSLLQSGIAGVNGNVERLQRQFGSLQQEIVNEIRRSNAKAAQMPPSSNEFRQKAVTSDTGPRIKRNRSHMHSEIWFYGAIFIVLIALIATILWFFPPWK